MITLTLHWHWIFPVIATLLYFKTAAAELTTGDYRDIYAWLYYGVPYFIFWLVYLLILHW